MPNDEKKKIYIMDYVRKVNLKELIINWTGLEAVHRGTDSKFKYIRGYACEAQ